MNLWPCFRAIQLAKNLQNGRHLKNPKIRDKCKAVSDHQTLTAFNPNKKTKCTYVYKSLMFSAIPCVFGQHLWNLYVPLILTFP